MGSILKRQGKSLGVGEGGYACIALQWDISIPYHVPNPAPGYVFPASILSIHSEVQKLPICFLY